jgi:hypothetical protein
MLEGSLMRKSYAPGTCSSVVFALTMAAAPALAQSASEQEPQPSRTSAVEVTPFLSMGSPRSARVGAAIDVPVTSNLSVEAELGYRRGEGDIHALSSSASVLYTLPRLGRVAPYLAAGAGLEDYGTPVLLPGRSELVTQSKLAFAVNAGGGLRVPVDDKWSLRSDARWFKALGRNGSEHWRLYQGISLKAGKRGK